MKNESLKQAKEAFKIESKCISEMLDFEETTKALMILEEKDSQKALELGKDIIKNNKGDDYLQATVWNVFFFENVVF